ncbi:MAG: hypothetical protein C0408_10095, partial [Odoribacter sp.]|nr:hypothetical protein [Odoribacter sp.]
RVLRPVAAPAPAVPAAAPVPAAVVVVGSAAMDDNGKLINAKIRINMPTIACTEFPILITNLF